MLWTITMPTKPGWYWHRSATPINGKTFPRVCEIVRVNGPHLLYCSGSTTCRVENVSGEWAGPIPEPEEVTKPDPLKPSAALLVKIGSLLVHQEEFLSPDGHQADRVAVEALQRDHDVIQWLRAMTNMALLPIKRKP